MLDRFSDADGTPRTHRVKRAMVISIHAFNKENQVRSGTTGWSHPKRPDGSHDPGADFALTPTIADKMAEDEEM